MIMILIKNNSNNYKDLERVHGHLQKTSFLPSMLLPMVKENGALLLSVQVNPFIWSCIHIYLLLYVHMCTSYTSIFFFAELLYNLHRCFIISSYRHISKRIYFVLFHWYLSYWTISFNESRFRIDLIYNLYRINTIS